MEALQVVSTRPPLLELLRAAVGVQACGWCCLRLVGVRSADSYACSTLPGTAAAVLAALQQQGDAAAGEAHAAVDSTEDGSKRRKVEAAPGDDGNAAGQAPAVCPLCLGLLQSAGLGGSASGSASQPGCPVQLLTTVSSLNDPARCAGIAWGGATAAAAADAAADGAAPAAADAAAAAAAAAAPDGDAGGSLADRAPVVEQRTAEVPSLATAAQAIAREFDFDSWALEVSLPASLAVRQQALRWRLQQQAGAHAQGAVEALAAAVDMKEAVRLCYTAALEAALGKPHDAEADLRIALTISHPEAAAECSWLAPSSGGGGWQRRGRGRRDGRAQQQQEQQPELPALTPAVVQRLAALSQADFAASCPAAAAQLACPAAATVRLQARRKPVHVGGRYLKLRRGIPQSPWFIDGQRKGEGSVQEAIEQVVLPALQADSYTLVSAGREDIDVRMLGRGRPFILEVHNARRAVPPPDQLRRLEAAVAEASAGGVAVRGLFAASPAQLAHLKEGEQEKQKSYVAVCWAPRHLSDADLATLEGTTELEVQQQTPVRVLHRRANLCRPKRVHGMRAWRLAGAPPGYFGLELRAQAGTYIKEFVHGDLGRSRPSVGDLLVCQACIVSLDVTDIHMDFGGAAGSGVVGGGGGGGSEAVRASPGRVPAPPGEEHPAA